jgi:hypothetical protein
MLCIPKLELEEREKSKAGYPLRDDDDDDDDGKLK